MNQETGTIHPFWRAVVGAGFGLAIGVVGACGGFWAAVITAILVLLGGILGVLLISGD
jgi:hypothetical protein